MTDDGIGGVGAVEGDEDDDDGVEVDRVGRERQRRVRALALLVDHPSTLHGAGAMAQEVRFFGSGSDTAGLLDGGGGIFHF